MNFNNTQYTGLTQKEVIDRINNKQTNKTDNNVAKTYKQIINDNLFTFFNFLNIFLFILLMLVRSYKNSLFIFVIAINTIVGIVQEIRSKKILDKLAIITKKNYPVIRDGNINNVSIDKLVLDDYLILENGDQVPSDCLLIDGYCEMNESLLTGESDVVFKNKNDQLFAGSFLLAGKIIAKINHVGNDNYISTITNQAKTHKKFNSQLNNAIDKILKYISIIILPVGLGLILKLYFYLHLPFEKVIISSVGAIIGMIPEGLILLTTVALSISLVKLAKQETLIQELFCIEALARIDTLCLDKTGTLTKGELEVVSYTNFKNQDITLIMASLIEALKDNNATSLALKKYFISKNILNPKEIIPFSSSRKYSGCQFENEYTYYLGAKEFLFKNQSFIYQDDFDNLVKQGYRVIVLAKSKENINKDSLPADLEILSLISLKDILRDNVEKTLNYFQSQGVELKVISGDNPQTVATIASRAGLKTINEIDTSNLNDDQLKKAIMKYNVFGRVSPNQKQLMVKTLQENKRTVAMTGDGVNDVLALKTADCSIAMASGSQASKDVSNIILLNNDFNTLPLVVKEGRRVINNITKSASMFLIKTSFSALLAIITILIGKDYPFQPIQLSFISACCVGIPTFFLTTENNYKQVKGSFIYDVFKNSLPYALSVVFYNILIINGGLSLGYNKDILITICLIITGWIYFTALINAFPLKNNFRKIIIFSMIVIFYLGLFIGSPILATKSLTSNQLLITLGLLIFTYPINIFNKFIFKKIFKTKENK